MVPWHKQKILRLGRGSGRVTAETDSPQREHKSNVSIRLQTNHCEAISMPKNSGVFIVSACALFCWTLNTMSLTLTPALSTHTSVSVSAFVHFFYYSDKMQTVLAVFCVLNLYIKPHNCIWVTLWHVSTQQITRVNGIHIFQYWRYIFRERIFLQTTCILAGKKGRGTSPFEWRSVRHLPPRLRCF